MTCCLEICLIKFKTHLLQNTSSIQRISSNVLNQPAIMLDFPRWNLAQKIYSVNFVKLSGRKLFKNQLWQKYLVAEQISLKTTDQVFKNFSKEKPVRTVKYASLKTEDAIPWFVKNAITSFAGFVSVLKEVTLMSIQSYVFLLHW